MPLYAGDGLNIPVAAGGAFAEIQEVVANMLKSRHAVTDSVMKFLQTPAEERRDEASSGTVV